MCRVTSDHVLGSPGPGHCQLFDLRVGTSYNCEAPGIAHHHGQNLGGAVILDAIASLQSSMSVSGTLLTCCPVTVTFNF